MDKEEKILVRREDVEFLAGLALEALQRIDDGDFSVIFGYPKPDGKDRYKKISTEIFSKSSNKS